LNAQKDTMNNWIRVGRFFYGTALAGIGLQHFLYSAFQPLIFPPWPHVPGIKIIAMVMGAGLIISGIIIVSSKSAEKLCLALGGIFGVIFLFSHVPYEFIIEPNSKIHLGLWTSALKELALSGGAFVLASSYTNGNGQPKRGADLLDKIKPYGRIFFAVMLVCFGLDHFYYPGFVSTLVPAWIPGPLFWTYFAGIALMGAGLAIALKIRLRLVSLLTGIMILIWFLILHIPGAVANPMTANGNEVTSAWSALAFSGIAFVLGGIS